MAKVITFINEKGGIGKTSTCFNVAWELSKKKRILMIDLDGQRANLTYFCGIKKTEDMLTITDVLKRNKSVKDVVVNVKDKLDILPADVDAEDITQTVKMRRMKDAIHEIADDYDFVFIDVSPSPNWRHFLALAASDYALIIMLPDMTSLESNNGILESIEEVQDAANPGLKVLGIVFNRNEERSNMSKQVKIVAEQFAKKLNTKIFNSKIRNAVALGEVAYVHEGITDYDAKSAVAQDVKDLIKEFIKEVK